MNFLHLTEGDYVFCSKGSDTGREGLCGKAPFLPAHLLPAAITS